MRRLKMEGIKTKHRGSRIENPKSHFGYEQHPISLSHPPLKLVSKNILNEKKMNVQTQSSLSLSTQFLLPPLSLRKPKSLAPPKQSSPFPKISSFKLVSAATKGSSNAQQQQHKPFPAEVSRTLMELSSVGTLSTVSQDGWPLGVGVRFAVDADNGTPVLCLARHLLLLLSIDNRSSLHVQLEQCGLRTPQCTIQGTLEKPADARRTHSVWKKRFGDAAADEDEDGLFILGVERVLQMEDFNQDGTWVTPSAYSDANPDPLRGCAEGFVNEINSNNMEDLLRFCNIYVDLEFQVSQAKMIWVDRLGFDIRVYSLTQAQQFDVRIPFPQEVFDEKGAKSSFNGMSQLAWEVEKNFHVPDFPKLSLSQTQIAS